MNLFQLHTTALDPQVLGLLAPLLVLLLGLDVWAIIDLFQPDRVVKGGLKPLWLLVILLVNPWGALIYFWLGRDEAPSRDDTPPNAPAAPITPIQNPKSKIQNPYEAIRTAGLGKDFGAFRALDSLDLVVTGPGVFGF